MAAYTIGIDIGTGSTKALAVDASGKVHATFQVHYALLESADRYCELDVETLWQAFVNCIRHIQTTLHAPPVAVSMSSAMHSVIAVDAQHRPLTNVITWADNRAANIARKIKHSSAGEMLYEQTGTPIHAMSPLFKIAWLKAHRAEIFKQAARFISIKEFIWFRLFNVYEVDYSIASATGLMDILSLRWNTNALAVCDIEPGKLSALVNTNYFRRDMMPQAANALSIPASTPVVIGSSDGCMANLGSFATEPGTAALTIGTSGAIRIASKTPLHNFDAMTFNYRLDTETFISGGPSNNGGVILKWYAENFLHKKLSAAQDYSTLLQSIKDTLPGADGLVFLPYLLGERAPIWDSESCGVFFGIRHQHRQEHFTRAVIEGISMALLDIASYMEKGGVNIRQIHVSGGFVHSRAWLQILADMFGKKIILVGTDDASALGTAYLALKTFGLIKSYSALQTQQTSEILPDMKVHELYGAQLKIYQELYKTLQAPMHNRSAND